MRNNWDRAIADAKDELYYYVRRLFFKGLIDRNDNYIPEFSRVSKVRWPYYK